MLKRSKSMLFKLLVLLVCTGTMATLAFAALPTITSVSPSTGTRGQTLDVIITGTNFYLPVSSMSVRFEPDWGGIRVNSFSIMLGGTRIRANITISATAVLGPEDIRVSNRDGTVKAAKIFTVVGRPSIRSVTPSRGRRGGAADVTIVGEGFLTPTISFGAGISATPPRVTTEYRPNWIATTISISSTAALGPRNVTVTTSYGTATSSFIVEAASTIPVVSSVLPSTGVKGRTLDVVIRGSSFSGATSVSFGADITVTAFRVASSTEIRATLSISPSAAVGPRDVSVTTSRGTGVGRSLFMIQSPLI
jgi:hypothetical protein